MAPITLRGDCERTTTSSSLIMNTPKDMPDIRKALFTSPGVDINEKMDSSAKTVNSCLQIEHDTDLAVKSVVKDCHEQRMKKFCQVAKHLHDDDWMYPPLEKLIGLK